MLANQRVRIVEQGQQASSKCIVAVDPRYFRPTEVETLPGDPTKAKTKLQWTPQVTFRELLAEMMHGGLNTATTVMRVVGFRGEDRVRRDETRRNAAQAA